MGPGQAGPWQPGGGPGYYPPGQYGPGQPGPDHYRQRPDRAGPGRWEPGEDQGSGWPGPGQRSGQEPRRPGGGRLGEPSPGGAAHPGPRDTGAWENAGPLIRQRDSALPDPPPAGKGAIASLEADNVGAFARDLRVLRSKAGLDYPEMAEKSHYTMRTLASAAGGLRLPTLPVLIAYVKSCGGDAAEWEERWGKLIRSGKKGQVALPAGGSAPSPGESGSAGGLPAEGRGGYGAAGFPGAGPDPQGPPSSGEVYVITSAPPRDDRW